MPLKPQTEIRKLEKDTNKDITATTITKECILNNGSNPRTGQNKTNHHPKSNDSEV